MKVRYRSRVFIPTAVLLLMCLAYVDYLTGLEFSLFPLYLIPLAVVTWNEEIRGGLCVLAVAVGCVWVKAVLQYRHLNGYLWYWDTSIKTALLVLLPYGLWKIKHLLLDLKEAQEELRQMNASLEDTVSQRTRKLSLTVEDLKREMAERTKLARDLQIETAERLRVEVALRERELLLMQQSRLAAMGEMIGNIAHQWRQPLNRLGLLAQDVLLTHEAGMADGKYLEEQVAKTMETIEHMSQTVEDFRNFFNPDREKVKFCVVDAIKTTLALLDEGLKPHRIETEIEQVGEASAIGFTNEFSQVLINIVGNAKDAFAARKPATPRIRFSAWTEGGTTYITITDNAGGIPEEVMPRIFEPYFTTKGPDEGTGLGLYMSKMIIERNFGGTVTVRNVGDGAEFKIGVPSNG